MSLNDIVNVVITSEIAQVTRQGFGVPLILTPHTEFAERVRVYTSLAGLVSDGFGSTTPAYKAAAALFSQSPRPPRVKVGRRANLPTHKFTLTPVAKNTHVYRVTISGVTFSYTSDADATATEIVTGLSAAINHESTGSSDAAATGTTTLILTADSAGLWLDLVADAADFGIACDHADAGIAADLTAVALEDDDWYGLVTTFNSAAEIAAAAAWVETKTKLYAAASSDTGIIGSGTSDVATTLKTAAYARTAAFYHPQNGVFADAAWLGRCLPLTPGSETWKFKTLAGVPAVALTPTQRTNAKGKRAAVYTTIGGINMAEEGVTASGEYIDVVRFRDWLGSRMQEDVFALLARSSKVPFTDSGIAGIESVVRGVLDEGVKAGGLSPSPEPTVSAPLASAVSSSDRAARTLPGVQWSARLAGAVHIVDPLQGVISV